MDHTGNQIRSGTAANQFNPSSLQEQPGVPLSPSFPVGRGRMTESNATSRILSNSPQTDEHVIPLDKGAILLPSKSSIMQSIDNRNSKKCQMDIGSSGPYFGGDLHSTACEDIHIPTSGQNTEEHVHWTAQSVVEWVESLVAATETEETAFNSNHQQAGGGGLAEFCVDYQTQPFIPPDDGGESVSSSVSLSSRNKPKPIRLNGIPMSYPSRVPPTAPWAMRVKSPATFRPSFQDIMEKNCIKDHAYTCGAANISDISSPSTVAPSGTSSLGWDMTYIHELDPQAYLYTSEIKKLAMEWEEYAANNSLLESEEQRTYEQLQRRLHLLVERIVGQKSNAVSSGWSEENNHEHRGLLVALYRDTAMKLDVLLQSIRGGRLQNDSDNDVYMEKVDMEVDSKRKTNNSNSSKSTPSATTTEEKKKLSIYMTEWLRKNWINPYPDEDGLQQIALDCNTTSTVVSNWLINARTRKWRPAILKALDLQRPAQCLLQDSLAIFSGQTVLPQQQRRSDVSCCKMTTTTTTKTAVPPTLSAASSMTTATPGHRANTGRGGGTGRRSGGGAGGGILPSPTLSPQAFPQQQQQPLKSSRRIRGQKRFKKSHDSVHAVPSSNVAALSPPTPHTLAIHRGESIMNGEVVGGTANDAIYQGYYAYHPPQYYYYPNSGGNCHSTHHHW